jgi:polysaccharide deacetylase 2 family uncharacterized protein YibQ
VSRRRSKAVPSLKWTILALGVLCAAAYAALLYLEHTGRPAPDVEPAEETVPPPPAPEYISDPSVQQGAEDAPPRPEPPFPRLHPVRAPGEPAKIAVILDDVGYDEAAVERAMAVGAPLTFAVLPNAPLGEALARRLHREGFEVWLHLPMEPEGEGANPGQGAVLVSMTREQIMGTVLDALKAVPYLQGVNTHMGSRATTRRDVMEWTLAPVRDWGLFFVDSKTTPETVAFETAKRLGIPCSIRDVFLDTEPALEYTRQMLERLETLAREQGTAVGIGHLYPTTLEALEKALPRLEARGVRLVSASEIVEEENLPLEP